MLIQLAIGSALILATTVIHGLWTLVGISLVRGLYENHDGVPSSWYNTLILAAIVLWLFLASVAEVWLWASVYLHLGALETLEEALYFSTVTFSTLGYGDVVLEESWRLLGAFEAANGLFLFGWSTALVFLVVQRLHFVGASKDQNSS
jgi:hypothetical protein